MDRRRMPFSPHLRSGVTVSFALGFVLLIATASLAQSPPGSFAALERRIRTGDRIFVIDRHGRETMGTVTRVSSAELVVENGADERAFGPADIGRIERPDSVWDGAVIGGLFFAPPTVLMAGLSCDARNCRGTMIKGGLIGLALGGALGARIDAAHGGRASVYSAERLPIGPVTAFADLWEKLKTGDRLVVVDNDGRETVATFEDASDASLIVIVGGRRKAYREGDVRAVTAQLGDGVRQGFWAGAVLGAVLAGFEAEGPAGERATVGLMAGMWYGAIGSGIGALQKPRSTVYRAPGRGPEPTVSIMPIVSPTQRGVLVSLAF